MQDEVKNKDVLQLFWAILGNSAHCGVWWLMRPQEVLDGQTLKVLMVGRVMFGRS